MRSIQNLCDRTILLDHGSVVADGKTSEVVDEYLKGVEGSEDDSTVIQDRSRESGHGEKVRIRACQLFNAEGKETTQLRFSEPFTIRMEFVGLESLSNVVPAAGIDTVKGERIATSVSEERGDMIDLREGEVGFASLTVDDLKLMPGRYSIALSVRNAKRGLDQVRGALRFDVLSIVYGDAPVPNDAWGAVYVSPQWNLKSSGPLSQLNRSHTE
jgi:lipopolysaccharide transport system ATP-binding protein